jgi:hypothetical protein
MSNTILKTFAGVAALGAIAFGASAIAGASGSSSSSSAGVGPRAGMPGGPPGGGPGRGFGFGQPVTGATAARVKAAALAKYPGTIERVEKLPNGNYVAHVFRSGGSEVHVRVSSSFQVTGVDSGPPGGGPPPGAAPGGAPPAATTPHRPGTSS